MRRHPDFSAIDKNVTAYGDKYEAVMLIDGINSSKKEGEPPMTWKDFNEYDAVRLKDGRDGVIADMVPGFNSFEFEYIDNEGDWAQETCIFDDIVEILDLRRKIPESSIGLCC